LELLIIEEKTKVILKQENSRKKKIISKLMEFIFKCFFQSMGFHKNFEIKRILD